MAQITPPRAPTCILVPDHRIDGDSWWTAEATVTQAGPHPGVPEAQQRTGLVLEARGTWEASASSVVELTTRRGGHADEVATFAWARDSEADTLQRGWAVPASLSGWEAVAWDDDAIGDRHPHLLTYGDDQAEVWVAYDWRSGTNSKVGLRVRSSAGVWASVVVLHSEPTTAGGDYLHPCLVGLPVDELGLQRVLLLHATYDTDDDTIQIRCSYTDDGATWVDAGTDLLPAAIDASAYTVRRIRCAYSGGTLILLVWVTEDGVSDWLYQYASASRGGGWTLVESEALVEGCPDVVGLGDGTLLAVTLAKASGGVRARILTSAWEPMSDVASTTVGVSSAGTWSGDLLTVGEAWVVRQESGDLYVGGTDHGAAGRGKSEVLVSSDDGVTWSFLLGSWLRDYDADTRPTSQSATWQRGRLLVAHNWAADPGDEDTSLGVAYLGGYSNAPTRHGWHGTWLPIELPGDGTWTRTASGSPTDTLQTPGELRVSTGVGGSLLYSQDPLALGVITIPATCVSDGMAVHAIWEAVSGGRAIVRLKIEDATRGFRAVVRYDPTASTLVVYDPEASSTLATIASVTGEQDTILAVRYNGTIGQAILYYRDADLSEDRTYTAAGPWTLQDTGGGGGTVATVTWGVDQAVGVADWRLVQWTEGRLQSADYTTRPAQIAAWIANDQPVGMPCRGYSQRWTYVDGGVQVRARSGPTYTGDAIQVPRAHTYARDSILPLVEASPRVGWRSTGETLEVLAWRVDGALGTEDEVGGVTIGLWLGGINWRSGQLDVHNGVGWSSLGAIDAATDLVLAYTRNGSTLVPSASAAAARYLAPDELAGCSVDLGSGKIRVITGNTGGYWVGASVSITATPVLYLTGCDDTEPASGTASAWARDLLVVRHLAAAEATAIRGYRLQIAAQTTAPSHGHFRIGSMVLGPLVAIGKGPSRGRSLTLTPQVEVETADDGTDWVRQRGPARRSWSLPWADLLPTVDLYDGAVPDRMANTSSGRPWALRRSVPLELAGWLRRLAGARTPVVYCPAVPVGPADWAVYTDRERAIYSRILGEVELESVSGDELVDEVWRSTGINGQEIV